MFNKNYENKNNRSSQKWKKLYQTYMYIGIENQNWYFITCLVTQVTCIYLMGSESISVGIFKYYLNTLYI